MHLQFYVCNDYSVSFNKISVNCYISDEKFKQLSFSQKTLWILKLGIMVKIWRNTFNLLLHCNKKFEVNSFKKWPPMLSVHFVCFVLFKIFYPLIGRIISVYITTSAIWCLHMGQQLVLWKVSTNDKDDYKTFHEKTPLIHIMVLSLWNYSTFLLEFTVSVFMHAIQKPATKKILVKGYRSVNTCYYA